MSARWLRNRNKISQDVFDGEEILHSIDEKFVDAFRRCQFEGRFQRIEQDRLTFFLDGAHTKESMEICTNWFKKQIENSKDAINVLVFNVTGDRDSAAILSSLHSMNFHHVCFATNIATSKSDNGKCGELKLISAELLLKFSSISLQKTSTVFSKTPNSIAACTTKTFGGK